MPQRLEADLFTQQDFYCNQGLAANHSSVSSPVIFEMNYLPVRINKRCTDKCGGFKNACYIKTELSVDWSFRQKQAYYMR